MREILNFIKKITIIICSLSICYSAALAQKNDCIRGDTQEWIEHLKRVQEPGGERNEFVPKLVRINFHFLLKSDGSGNFTETDDGLGNSKSGYDVSYDLMERMTSDLAWNRPTLYDGNAMPNLPPVEDRKYNYVLDAIYFHRDDNRYYFYNPNFGQTGKDKTEVINVFFSEKVSSDPNENTTIVGYVLGSGGNNNTTNKFTDIANLWDRYNKYLTLQEPYAWFLHSATNTIMHEIIHTKGLLHTVYKGGSSDRCDETDPTCDDGIADTPTAYEVFNHANCGIHPANGWVNTHPCSSKNLMDYEGGHALTPDQISVIHAKLKSGMKTYNLCDAVNTNTVINTLGFPKLSYYGKEVDIKPSTSGSSVVLSGNQPADLYFSSDIEFFPLEIEGETGYKTKMEVFHYETCSF
jgi:hypothetical protein